MPVRALAPVSEEEASLRRGLPSLVLLLAVSTFLLSGSPASGVYTDDEPLKTGPIQIAGSVETSASSGGFSALGPGWSLDATARAVDIHFESHEGARTSANADSRLLSRTVESHEENRSFGEASIHVSRAEQVDGQSQIIGYNSSASMEGSGIGTSTLTPNLPMYLGGHGASPDTEGGGESSRPSFWLEPEDAWVGATGADHLVVAGDLRLFVNNASVAIHEEEEDPSWKNWTGVKTEAAGPTTETYEQHLLLLELEGARLSLSGEDAIDLYSAEFETNVQGVLEARGTEGSVIRADFVHKFEGEEMTLRGEGQLAVSRPERNDAALSDLRVGISRSSDLEVLDGQGIQHQRQASSGGFDAIHALALGIVGSSGAALAIRRNDLRNLWSRFQSRRYEQAMTRGRELANGGDVEEAISHFDRARDIRPRKTTAWYHLCVSLLEEGRHRDVLDVVEEARANDVLLDHLDFLELETQAAYFMGDAERVREVVDELASACEPMASGLVLDLQIPESVIGPELARRLMDDGEEDLFGYV